MNWDRPTWRDIPDVVRETEFDDEMPPLQTIGQAARRLLPMAELSAEVSKHTESPIETMLAVSMLISWYDVELRAYGTGFGPDWTLIPQHPWGRYRIDFVLRHADGRMFFIECDGKEFHSSPEQIERDERRDQEITAAGHKVFRFTGAEINHCAVACINLIPRQPWQRRWA